MKSANTRKTAKQLSLGSALRVHVLLHRAIGLLLGSVPGVAGVIANTFLVAPPLIARPDREISSLLADLVIAAGPNATRSLVLDPLKAIFDCKSLKNSIDRFAFDYNTKLPTFNSRFLQLGTEAVDAFTQDW